MLSDVILSVIIKPIYAECCYRDYHKAKYHYLTCVMLLVLVKALQSTSICLPWVLASSLAQMQGDQMMENN